MKIIESLSVFLPYPFWELDAVCADIMLSILLPNPESAEPMYRSCSGFPETGRLLFRSILLCYWIQDWPCSVIGDKIGLGLGINRPSLV